MIGHARWDVCWRIVVHHRAGLIYRMVQPKIGLLIFVSGKVVLTGGKVRNEIFSAFEQIYPVLQEFRKLPAAAAATALTPAT
ncbi:hypothetical protein EMIHUDRAFT_219064 [Emiliania huxleyi CCMP1516]|uniref:TATA-box binding protein n=2 Tax=Emiliania huxleyi TaxID=2903 RepID=A0A0D3I5M5_EMIH1|nr:hypothetical protein EMIHUDRAFT_219064 [Emiliania huxleyi CCMP1516]EOD06560.1 hypothetical protein EMIHUDRAFT_219064 [Emiliania huxleyi CCMP1516]|eukprot:XP_005758989.1 hypothetical protein EMIHUDRAFT_219064 [Emiliania huxleyi CCMP1516]